MDFDPVLRPVDEAVDEASDDAVEQASDDAMDEASDEELGGADGSIWLDGDVLACACPDCGAPMSIRLWLMVADCWRCNTSIELTEEQEEEALRLLRDQEESRRHETAEAAATIAPTLSRRRKPKPEPELEPEPEPEPEPEEELEQEEEEEYEEEYEEEEPEEEFEAEAIPKPRPAPPPQDADGDGLTGGKRRVAAYLAHRGARAHVRKLYEKGGLVVLLSRLFDDLPAWLVSLVVHIVAMLLLSLWVASELNESESITLSTSVSYEDILGDMAIGDPLPIESPEFIDGGDAVEVVNDIQEAGAAEEPPVVETVQHIPVMAPSVPAYTPTSSFTATVAEIPPKLGKMFAGRDPKNRAQILHTAGGTSETEAAVARGLKFLSRYQNKDGSWSLHTFQNAKEGDPNIGGQGGCHSDTAATAMGLLPFLGAGQTHLEGEYKETILAGIKWLVEHQGENGDLRGQGNGRMYAHAQAAIALCEAYQLSGDAQLHEPAQLALNYIIAAQHPGGGWRYEPGQAGDTSVVGWQLMALKSGQAAGLRVPKKTFEAAKKFIDKVQTDEKGARYAYTPGHGPTHVMTAEALLCRQYLGWSKREAGLREGIDFLLKDHAPDAGKPSMYYWYYATQVMHHYGGSQWNRWNAKMRKVLVDTQENQGPAAGSWQPRGGHANQGGRIYMTALAICTLEVYYRHAPLYSEKMLEELE